MFHKILLNLLKEENYNYYYRYRKRLKQLQERIPTSFVMVPLSTNASVTNVTVTNLASNIATAVWSGMNRNGSSSSCSAASTNPNVRRVPSPGKVSPEVVFFCRKVYDFRQKRMLKNPS